ncbi:MAG: hypothetical protein QOK25_2838 [Thermoleophilaceae bacterium]|nr:hypothetical protein [Thermoleophilaceae bacterium]
MRCERGQAAVEWVGLVLLVALALAGFAAVVPVAGGHTLGQLLVRRVVCAVSGDCRDPGAGADAQLVAAYGVDGAGLVRRYAPNIAYEPGTYTLPVDWRQCRSHRCSDAPDRGGLDVHRSARGGYPATAFTHLVRSGGRTFLQYWFYYPDSTTTWGAAAAAWAIVDAPRRSGNGYSGFHLDDWEGYQVRVDPGGRAFARATAHHGYQYCMGPAPRCHDRWGPWTGWTRVSRGSHAGHIPLTLHRTVLPDGHGPHGWRGRLLPTRQGVDVHERTTTAPDLRLVPLEPIDPRSYHPLQRDGPTPPWAKDVYRDPASNSTG